MKSLVEFIAESIIEEAKFNVIADEESETNQKDYIKLVVVDKNFEPQDEVGFVAVSELGKNPSNNKTWLPDLGKYIGKNHHLSNTDAVSVQYWDDDEEDWVQFAGVYGNGKVNLWDPDAIEGKNPFK